MSGTVFGWRVRGDDGRPLGEVERDIRDELDAHLALAQADLEAHGLAAQDARAEALRRFGDPERIVRDVRNVHVARLLAVRAPSLVALGLALAVLVLVLWQQAALRRDQRLALARIEQRLATVAAGGPVAPPPPDAASFLGAIAGRDWREVAARADELAHQPPDVALAILREDWPRITDPEARQQVLKSFAFSRSPAIVSVLVLGATDADPEVRNWAFPYLAKYAMADLSGDREAFDSWRREWADKPVPAILEASARRLTGELATLDDEGAKRLFGSPIPRSPADAEVGDSFGVDVSRILRDGGAGEVAARWLASDDPQLRVVGAELMTAVRPDEALARRVVLPLLASGQLDLETHSRLAASVGRPDCKWAVVPLLADLDATADTDWSSLGLVAMAIAGTRDAAAVPRLIARLVRAENAGLAPEVALEVRHSIGNHGLRRLTGVDWSPSHDARWWTEWWERNRATFAPEVRATPLPVVTTSAKAPVPAAPLPSEERQAGGDARLAYVLHGPRVSPAAGARIGLLVVLPGGDGGRDFTPFVHSIAENVLPEDWALAQVVAVKWRPGQEIVWPRRGLPVEGMEHPTEEVVARVIADAGRVHEVDPERTFVLGWSSGGPAAYACALASDVPVAGAFVAMSVWKPEQMPPLAQARGRAIWIDHGRDDSTCPYPMAQQAERDLASAGARVHLETWPGGHGWQGPVWDRLGKGLTWLSAGAVRGSPR